MKVALSCFFSHFGLEFTKFSESQSVFTLLPETHSANEFNEAVLQADVVIVDMFELAQQRKLTQYMEQILASLKNSPKKRIIGVSSVITWGNGTKNSKNVVQVPARKNDEFVVPEENAGEKLDMELRIEETALKNEIIEDFSAFMESNYVERLPLKGPIVQSLYLAENELLSIADKHSVVIVAAGFLYGSGESVFKSLFVDAWKCEKDVSCLDAKSNVPTISAIDLSAMISNFVSIDSSILVEHPYIVAIDAVNSLTDIANTIVSSLSTFKVEYVPRSKLPLEENCWDFLSHNYNFQVDKLWAHSKSRVSAVTSTTNEILDDNQKESDESVLLAPSFEWRFFGIVKALTSVSAVCNPSHYHSYSNIPIIAQFIETNKLYQSRIWVHGAPGAGKSYLSDLISKHNGLPIISLSSLISNALEKKDEKSAELEKAMIPNPDKKNKKKDKRIPVEMVVNLYAELLNTPIYRNRGFILDGFPRTLEESKLLFERSAIKVEHPNRVILLRCSSTQSAERHKNLPASTVVQFHNDDEGLFDLSYGFRVLGFKRRWEAYDTNYDINKEQCPLNLIESANIISVDTLDSIAATYEVDCAVRSSVLTFIDAIKPAHIGLKASLLPIIQSKYCSSLNSEVVNSKIKSATINTFVLNVAESSILEISEKEVEILGELALPFRSYLVDTVGEIVTRGLIDVCKIRPENPIEYLGEYFRDEAIKRKL